VITDLDATKSDRTKCWVSEGTRTSNACLHRWFDNSDITPAELITKTADEKTLGIQRLAYQVPEVDAAPCGRSFEDAFILANPGLFELSAGCEEEEAWAQAQSEKKSDFALKYAIANTEWQVPRYIAEGLRWLAEGSRGLTLTPSPPFAETPNSDVSSDTTVTLLQVEPHE